MAGTPTIAQLAQWCAIVVVLAPFVGAASALFAVRASSHLRARIPATVAVLSAVLAIAVVARVLAAGTVRLDPRGLLGADAIHPSEHAPRYRPV